MLIFHTAIYLGGYKIDFYKSAEFCKLFAKLLNKY